MVVRIAHLSDTHLGARPQEGIRQNIWAVEMRSRLLENDFYDRFEEIFSAIAALDPPVDVVVHSGDLYDSPWEGNPSQPPVVAQETAIRVLKDFIEQTGIPVVIIEGNHGLFRTLEVSLLDTLRLAVPGLYVATQQDLKRAFASGEPLMFGLDELDVFCFPFMQPGPLRSADLMPEFEGWVLEHQAPTSADRPSIAVAHGMSLDGTLYSSILSHRYDYIALGHDHRQHKHSAKAWYAGSPERWRFDEAGHEKGFLVVEVSPGSAPHVEPHIIEFRRPVLNKKLSMDGAATPQSVVAQVEDWLKGQGFVGEFDPETAARVRIVLEGSPKTGGTLETRIALEALRSSVLARDSTYNIAQFVWDLRSDMSAETPLAYPEIESEYLIESPEDDFREYLSTLDIGEKYSPDVLTKIAVRALRLAVGADTGKMVPEEFVGDFMDEDSEPQD